MYLLNIPLTTMFTIVYPHKNVAKFKSLHSWEIAPQAKRPPPSRPHSHNHLTEEIARRLHPPSETAWRSHERSRRGLVQDQKRPAILRPGRHLAIQNQQDLHPCAGEVPAQYASGLLLGHPVILLIEPPVLLQGDERQLVGPYSAGVYIV